LAVIFLSISECLSCVEAEEPLQAVKPEAGRLEK
jgi:hypothetical protein